MNFQLAEFEAAAGEARQLPGKTVPEIVFAGKSNVGKSSLINKILNRKALARTSSSPGKTVTVNFYRVDTCRFVDLPGYGYAKRSKSEKERWGRLIGGYLVPERGVNLVITLLDMRHELTENDCDMIDFLIDGGFPFVVVCTKSDKLNVSERKKQTAYFDELFFDRGYLWLPFSAQTGENVDKIREIIEKHTEMEI